MKKILALVSSLIFFSTVFYNLLNQKLVVKTSQPASEEKNAISGQMFKVARVIDGDTIELEDGEKVRYIGIDTPETVDPRKKVQCFGKEASDKNKQLVEKKMVRLEKDVSEIDRYGRLLRYVYVKDANNVGDVFVNDYLVRQGFAHAVTFPPDVKYSQQFVEAEKEARGNNRGLWAACGSLP